jgi:predicted nucleic acid-binding protein
MVGAFDGVNNLSDADCSVIILAQRYNCRLLTSDRKLKRQAEDQGLRVNGLLWITDTMVENGILTGAEMIPYLERYRETNPRAPQNEINKRIEKYKE